MSYSCFGCCSIRSGIGFIAIINMLWITLVLMINFMFRLSSYGMYSDHSHDYDIRMENTTSETFSDQQDSNDTIEQPLNQNIMTDDIEWLVPPPLMKIFMNYIFIVKTAWYVMEFYLNMTLKQSTYTVSPQRIYAWLVIYYLNLGRAIIFQCMTIVTMPSFQTNNTILMGFFDILVIVVEAYFVQLYYNQQKLASVDNFVALKWNYHPSPKMKFNKPAEHVTKTITTKRCDVIRDDSGYIPIFVKNLRNINS